MATQMQWHKGKQEAEPYKERYNKVGLGSRQRARDQERRGAAGRSTGAEAIGPNAARDAIDRAAQVKLTMNRIKQVLR